MGTALRTGTTADIFVETTLEVIAEESGAGPVNLRRISRRIGCAHTNVYNYFATYQDLLWAAFRRTLVIYGAWLTRDLDDRLPESEYLRRVLTNLATFPQEHPGLYRFIASDRLPMDQIPHDVLETVSSMKRWLSETLRVVSMFDLEPSTAATIADIVLAYVDGETLNLINGRVVPGEDLAGRVVDNAMQVHRLLVHDAAAGSSSRAPHATAPATSRGPYPKLELTPQKGA